MSFRCVCLLLISATHATPTIAASITFNTALPVSKNEFIIRNQIIVNRASDSDTSLTAASLVSTLVYGVTPTLAVFTTLPVTSQRLKTQNDQFTNTGLGDTELLARYTAYQQNSAGKTFRLAPFIGAKLPTGDEDTNSSPSLALGSGSFGFSTGLVATYATSDWTLDSQLAYRNNGNSNDIEFGDTFTFDASLQYRLLPKQLSATSTAFLNGVIELNVTDQRQNTSNGVNNKNSGGTAVFIAPGLQYITQRWILESSLQIPIQTNNAPLENDYIARIGVRTNF